MGHILDIYKKVMGGFLDKNQKKGMFRLHAQLYNKSLTTAD